MESAPGPGGEDCCSTTALPSARKNATRAPSGTPLNSVRPHKPACCPVSLSTSQLHIWFDGPMNPISWVPGRQAKPVTPYFDSGGCRPAPDMVCSGQYAKPFASMSKPATNLASDDAFTVPMIMRTGTAERVVIASPEVVRLTTSY